MPKEEAAQGADELSLLAARPRRVTVYTVDSVTDELVPKVVRVAPMTLDICADAMAAIRPIVETFGTAINGDDLPAIIAQHAGSARALVAVATGEAETYIGDLPFDQFLTLATVVWDVNYDFFVRRVGPVAKALMQKIVIIGAGPTQLTSSPSTGT